MLSLLCCDFCYDFAECLGEVRLPLASALTETLESYVAFNIFGVPIFNWAMFFTGCIYAAARFADSFYCMIVLLYAMSSSSSFCIISLSSCACCDGFIVGFGGDLGGLSATAASYSMFVGSFTVPACDRTYVVLTLPSPF